MTPSSGYDASGLVFDWNNPEGLPRKAESSLEFVDASFEHHGFRALESSIWGPYIWGPYVESLRVAGLSGAVISVGDLFSQQGREWSSTLRQDALPARLILASEPRTFKDMVSAVGASQANLELLVPCPSEGLLDLAPAIERAAQRGHVITLVVGAEPPEMLSSAVRDAVASGVSRICFHDREGKLTPDGVRNLVSYLCAEGKRTGYRVDFRGGNQRGLALENAVNAIANGAKRVYGTALGFGGRDVAVGLLMFNLNLRGMLNIKSPQELLAWGTAMAATLDFPVPANFPVFGRDAFRTASGVHAAALVKAETRGDSELADRVYSSVPAGTLGRQQEVCVSHMSGSWNVAHWLHRRGLPPTRDNIEAVLAKAKTTDHMLEDDEILPLLPKEPRKD